MLVPTAGLSNLSEVVVSLNPLEPAGLLSLLHSLPTDHLSSLDLSNTCTNQPLTATLEEPRVVYFFSQVSCVDGTGNTPECVSQQISESW